MTRISALAVGLAFAFGSAACKQTPDPSDAATTASAPVATKANAPSRPQGPRVLIEAGAGLLKIPVELATTHKERQQGLMYRRSLKADSGMLFVFERQQIHRFWMKNTYIPLDMIFITEQMTVAGVVHRAQPETETARFVQRPSRYVLEVNGGFAQSNGITVGDRVVFEGVQSSP